MNCMPLFCSLPFGRTLVVQVVPGLPTGRPGTKVKAFLLKGVNMQNDFTIIPFFANPLAGTPTAA